MHQAEAFSATKHFGLSDARAKTIQTKQQALEGWLPCRTMTSVSLCVAVCDSLFQLPSIRGIGVKVTSERIAENSIYCGLSLSVFRIFRWETQFTQRIFDDPIEDIGESNANQAIASKFQRPNTPNETTQIRHKGRRLRHTHTHKTATKKWLVQCCWNVPRH